MKKQEILDLIEEESPSYHTEEWKEKFESFCETYAGKDAHYLPLHFLKRAGVYDEEDELSSLGFLSFLEDHGLLRSKYRYIRGDRTYEVRKSSVYYCFANEEDSVMIGETGQLVPLQRLSMNWEATDDLQECLQSLDSQEELIWLL